MNAPEIVRLKNLVNESDHVLGPQSAPVTLLEYGNLECIYCGQAHPVIKHVRQLLGDNLRLVFRHFPRVETHPRALRAAEAVEAANAQGKFWQMLDELFNHQQALDDRQLSRYAARIGLEVARFERDLAEHTFLKQIETDYQNALFDEHVTGTPTFYINELRYTGRVDVDSLLAAIKAADSEGRIEWPQTTRGIKKLFGRLRGRGTT
jgi:protein-disulfide isomerase